MNTDYCQINTANVICWEEAVALGPVESEIYLEECNICNVHKESADDTYYNVKCF